MRVGRGRRHDFLVFEATQSCNHDCPHCYNVWKNPIDYPRGALSTRKTLRMLDRVLDATGARLLTISGGEPLLRPDIFEIVDHVAARGVGMNFISNGSLLTRTTVDRLRGKNIRLFELPLLSADRRIHDRMSGRPGAFDGVTRAIAALKDAGEQVVVVFVATRWNLPGWEETAELAVILGVDGIMFNRFNPGGRGAAHLDTLQASPADLTRALEAAEALSVRHGIPISCGIAMPHCLFDRSRYPHLGFGDCAAGTSRAYYTVDPLGNLRPCNHSSTILGNVLRQDFWSLVFTQPMRAFVAARPPFCAGCVHEETCLGGCKAAAEVCRGSVNALDPFLEAYLTEAEEGKARIQADVRVTPDTGADPSS